jgi:hypothetical protein
MVKIITLFILFCAISHDIYTQSRKKVLNYGIKSVTVIKEDYKDSNGKETLRSMTVFDENGNVIEEKDYDKAGKLQERITYEYNSDNDKIKETSYQPNNKVKESFTYKYENGLITERCKYDWKNRLISRRKYIYEFVDE